ncbi:hypothetical protein SANTM175S_07680 [Streptomyces antimycoticus]
MNTNVPLCILYWPWPSPPSWWFSMPLPLSRASAMNTDADVGTSDLS